VRLGGWFTFVSTCVLAALAPRVGSAQHITIDGRLSPAQTLVGPNYTIGANLGKEVGSNLFHSFGQFSLASTPVPESATFTSTGSTGPISNVIGRVTGGNQSSINGAIVSSIPGANLYLINPSGIVFGPNATVNVSGSFRAATADYLKMSDGAKFQATNPDGSSLSAAPPVAFGFLTASPSKISVNGSTLGPVPGTLGLVGGPVSIKGGATLSAPAGTIHVTSAAGTGEVPVDPRNTPDLTVASFGRVKVKGSSTLDVSDPSGLGSGGSVFIRAGALTISASEINADNYGSGPGGTVFLRGESQIALNNSAFVHAVSLGSGSGAGVVISTTPSGVFSTDASAVLTESTGPGNAGSLAVSAGLLTVTNGALLGSIMRGAGSAAPIEVSANMVAVGGGMNPNSVSLIGSLTRGPAAAADVSVAAGNLTIVANGEIGSFTYGPGNAGRVAVSVPGTLSIDGTPAFLTGIFSATETGSSGAAGTVSVNTGSLSIKEDGLISVATFDSGNAGSAIVTAGSLRIVSGGEISGNTFASGNAGSISISVPDALLIDGAATPNTSPASPTGIFSQANSSGSTGAPGTVTISAGSLSILNGGIISTSTFGPGNGGSISVTAQTLSIVGNGSAILDNTLGSGNAGQVTVSAGTLSIADNGTIGSSASVFGPAVPATFLSLRGRCRSAAAGKSPATRSEPVMPAK
jgi:filamentous hemagglutinin family protein